MGTSDQADDGQEQVRARAALCSVRARYVLNRTVTMMTLNRVSPGELLQFARSACDTTRAYPVAAAPPLLKTSVA